ncbi:glycoside hydrolase family 43 protein [Cerasicoccus maritimus]|uniref:glycoside hydrolase family 43 protein n=1 Tax=Cerasicoccus maritimus TaxID=490089 RepID=UPI002852B8F3|nr:family 43 glycosylhydrolase [Cerasicoccus maritimus]
MPSLPSNPILTGMHPDPTICRVGNKFYLATSSFGQFPGVPLYESENLQEWKFLRHILSRPSQLPFQHAQNFITGGIFAPTIRHDGKRFYLITTNIDNGGHFIVTTENPADEWSEPIWIDPIHQGGIDPSLTFLKDGRTLFQATAAAELGEEPGLIQFEIDPLSGKGLTERKNISSGFGGKAVEGPHIFFRGEFWYLLAAEGGTESNHRVTIGRSASPWGPFTACPDNPIFTHAGIESPIQNTGHADMVSDQAGNWWMVFLGVRTIGYPPVHICGRETFIAPVKWENDWPVVNHAAPVSESTLAQRGGSDLDWMDDFSSTQLGHRWVTIASTYQKATEIAPGVGFILKALSTSLSASGPIGFLGTRLTERSIRCSLTISSVSINSEGGICVYMNKDGYYSLGIRRSNDQSFVRFTKRILDMVTVVETPIELSENYHFQVVLTAEGDPWSADSSSFIFNVATEDGVFTEIGRGISRLLSTEVIGGFSGLLIGPYCLSAQKNASMTLKHFAYMNTQPQET